ncbi:MAG: methyltransferase family protein [Woeseiaceae bacterium]
MYPLVILLIALVSSYALNRYLPVREIVPELIRYLGAVPVLAAIWIVGKSALRFRRHDTTVMPYEKSSALVTDGFYEYSRNPMYLAMLLFPAGVAWLLGSVTAFLPLPFMYGILRFRVIAMEEAMLEETFGEEYLAYKRKVRRWL